MDAGQSPASPLSTASTGMPSLSNLAGSLTYTCKPPGHSDSPPLHFKKQLQVPGGLQNPGYATGKGLFDLHEHAPPGARFAGLILVCSGHPLTQGSANVKNPFFASFLICAYSKS